MISLVKNFFMKLLKIFTLILLVTSCAPIYVTQDFEKNTDFSKYKTYNYYDNLQTGLNPFDTKRLLHALDNQLQSQGLTMSENPDFYINIKSAEWNQRNQSNVGVGVGGGSGGIGGGISVGIPIGKSNVTRQIQFDFIDENGIGLFWQAVSQSDINLNASPKDKEARFQAIVMKVFKNYPPKQ